MSPTQDQCDYLVHDTGNGSVASLGSSTPFVNFYNDMGADVANLPQGEVKETHAIMEIPR